MVDNIEVPGPDAEFPELSRFEREALVLLLEGIEDPDKRRQVAQVLITDDIRRAMADEELDQATADILADLDLDFGQ